MFTFIGKLFATLTCACNSLHILAQVGEDHAIIVKAESDAKLRIRRAELDKEVALALA